MEPKVLAEDIENLILKLKLQNSNLWIEVQYEIQLQFNELLIWFLVEKAENVPLISSICVKKIQPYLKKFKNIKFSLYFIKFLDDAEIVLTFIEDQELRSGQINSKILENPSIFPLGEFSVFKTLQAYIDHKKARSNS